MTPVEPGIIDTNVLVYAMDADIRATPPHVLCSMQPRNRSTTLYVISQILGEFYSIVTNPRRIPKPRSCADAIAAISSMLDFLRVLPSSARVATALMGLLQRHPVTGGEVFDLQIVATMQANNIQRIYTFNASTTTLSIR